MTNKTAWSPGLGQRPPAVLLLLLLIQLSSIRCSLSGRFALTQPLEDDTSYSYEELVSPQDVLSPTDFFQQGPDAGPRTTVLVLSILRDGFSWGGKSRPGRSMYDYLNVLSNLTHPQIELSLGLLISDAREYTAAKCRLLAFYSRKGSPKACKDFVAPDKLAAYSHVKRLAFQRMAMLRVHPGDEISAAIDLSFRHADNVQKERRRALARYRNLLLSTALNDEYAVLWVDADMEIVPSHMLPLMIESGLDIICPATYVSEWGNLYDRNVWKGPIGKLTPEELAAVSSGTLYINKDYYPRGRPLFLDQLAKRNASEFVEIDSVGATVLYVKSIVHKQGAIFPPGYFVGSTWASEGYDGIETEGLCYLARMMDYKCWGMPHLWIYHVPYYN